MSGRLFDNRKELLFVVYFLGVTMVALKNPYCLVMCSDIFTNEIYMTAGVCFKII